jgi:signal transduction histidine kinase/DNA-binding response OmpR family regulator
MTAEDKANILVVDDLPAKLLSLETILQDLDQNVVTARSGREALRRLLERDYAVILLDVNMPDMNGFETAALIRQRPRTEHTPILFITAYGDEFHAAQGYSLGAVDYILSPVVPDVLRTKVGVFVDLYRKTEQVKRQAREHVALAREQAARAAAEEVTRRSLFLAEASKILMRSLDPAATLRGLVRQAVPFLGDLGAGVLVDSNTDAWKTELAWTDPASGARRQAALNKEALAPALAEAVRRALDTGKTELLPEASCGPPADPAHAVQTSEGQQAPGPDFAVTCTLALPLQARGRTLGALLLAMGPSGRLYDASQRALAEDLAGRAALALDNARLYRDIQEEDRRKNEFLAMLAHELRNPLAPIRNAAQVLHLAGLGPQQQQWARGVIERQVQQLTRLVDDLLDVSRITRGKINLKKESVDVAAVVGRAVEISRPLIDQRKHTLHLAQPPEPLRAVVDPVRLAQVLANLLNNAAKYTEEGGTIWLTVERAGDELVFRVRDTGIGIQPELLPQIFNLFTQASRSLDRSQGGLGIGLTLARRLVEMHGGSLQAFSAGTNQGSEFVVRLPVLSELPPPPSSESPPPTSAASFRVLVVDDNVDAAESLALLLRTMGQVVQTAFDGPAALEAAEAFGPDVVLLDIGLPGMDGYEVAQELRRRGLGDVVLVALTGYGQQQDLARARAAGFDHHLVKPADISRLPELFASFHGTNRSLLSGTADH